MARAPREQTHQGIENEGRLLGGVVESGADAHEEEDDKGRDDVLGTHDDGGLAPDAGKVGWVDKELHADDKEGRAAGRRAENFAEVLDDVGRVCLRQGKGKCQQHRQDDGVEDGLADERLDGIPARGGVAEPDQANVGSQDNGHHVAGQHEVAVDRLLHAIEVEDERLAQKDAGRLCGARRVDEGKALLHVAVGVMAVEDPKAGHHNSKDSDRSQGLPQHKCKHVAREADLAEVAEDERWQTKPQHKVGKLWYIFRHKHLAPLGGPSEQKEEPDGQNHVDATGEREKCRR